MEKRAASAGPTSRKGGRRTVSRLVGGPTLDVSLEDLHELHDTIAHNVKGSTEAGLGVTKVAGLWSSFAVHRQQPGIRGQRIPGEGRQRSCRQPPLGFSSPLSLPRSRATQNQAVPSSGLSERPGGHGAARRCAGRGLRERLAETGVPAQDQGKD